MLDQMETHHILMAYALFCIWMLQRIRQEKQKIERDRLRRQALKAPYETTGHCLGSGRYGIGVPTRLTYQPGPLPDHTCAERYRYHLVDWRGRSVWRQDDYNHWASSRAGTGPNPPPSTGGRSVTAALISETLTKRPIYVN